MTGTARLIFAVSLRISGSSEVKYTRKGLLLSNALWRKLIRELMLVKVLKKKYAKVNATTLRKS